MDLDILKSLSLFALLQVIIWFVYLLNHKKSNPRQKWFLIKLSVLFAVFVIGVLFLVFGNTPPTYFVANITNLTIYLALPVVFNHLRNEQDIKKLFLHYLPFGLIVLCSVFIMFFTSIHKNYFHQYAITLIVVFYLQFIFYAYLFINDKRIKELEYLYWFKPFIVVFAILMILISSIYAVWNVFSSYELCIILSSIFFVTSFIIINLLILFALLKSENLLPVLKYRNSNVASNEIDELYKRIYQELITNGAYKDPLINLQYLSKKLIVSPGKISRTINEKLGQNLNELINSHRIKDAEQLILSKDENDRIIDIAYEVGYNSKSTFNTAFKKYTGLTPTEYKKKYAKI